MRRFPAAEGLRLVRCGLKPPSPLRVTQRVSVLGRERRKPGLDGEILQPHDRALEQLAVLSELGDARLLPAEIHENDAGDALFDRPGDDALGACGGLGSQAELRLCRRQRHLDETQQQRSGPVCAGFHQRTARELSCFGRAACVEERLPETPDDEGPFPEVRRARRECMGALIRGERLRKLAAQAVIAPEIELLVGLHRATRPRPFLVPGKKLLQLEQISELVVGERLVRDSALELGADVRRASEVRKISLTPRDLRTLGVPLPQRLHELGLPGERRVRRGVQERLEPFGAARSPVRRVVERQVVRVQPVHSDPGNVVQPMDGRRKEVQRPETLLAHVAAEQAVHAVSDHVRDRRHRRRDGPEGREQAEELRDLQRLRAPSERASEARAGAAQALDGLERWKAALCFRGGLVASKGATDRRLDSLERIGQRGELVPVGEAGVDAQPLD